jgi:hypothetical protein
MTDSGGTHGDSGGGLDGGLGSGTGIKTPPQSKVGEGGGLAMPSGPVIDKSDKDLDHDVSTLFDGYTDAFWAACAWSTFGEPFDAEFQGAVCGIAAGLNLAGDVMDLIVDDPPQPAYARPVVFKQRVSNPPKVTDAALEPLRVCTQQAVFASVTAQGFLDPIERLQGAQLAGDVTWALVHQGVADLARQQLIVDIANNGSALYAAGNALKGTRYDLALKPGMGGVKKWINKRGKKALLTAAMQASGFTPAEITKTIAYLNTDPKYTGPASTLSKLMIENAEKIYALAIKLNETT